MLFRCNCPRCGTKKEYIAEQVGQTSYCNNCGNEFELKANDGRVVRHIVGATLFVVAIIAGILIRAYWKAGIRNEFQRAATAVHQRTVLDDED